MNPGKTILDNLELGESLLSLCCGIGFELKNASESDLADVDVTGVDIVPEYVAVFAKRYPNAKTVVSDALDYMLKAPSDSVDVISFIDGVEHLTKRRGRQALKECKRVARKRVYVFTPEGFTENHPEHTWDIEGGDVYQHHLSGWEVKELETLGYKLIAQHPATSVLGQDYNESMYEYKHP